ncbi:type II toxin-antitoxin system VapC family toxin [Massilia horti]|uniref:Ribonuclease VapC n=1 Tax=Massilia horti TaxID=2562153 RepID=A0A4Y9T4X2_9BURK|nr:type II toxin-antitoxin system VapC family toxin [Massilia horti]TFW35813.1 PIN domain-containing protein [Massilia horti]
MRYVDTSVLVAYLTPEAGSEAADAFMRSAGSPLAISGWTEVELLSAIGLKIRTKQIELAMAHEVFDTYSRLVAPHLRRIAIEDVNHSQAALLLDGWATALRAADALHLAIAAAHDATVYTFDGGMAAAGKEFGIRAQLLTQPMAY